MEIFTLPNLGTLGLLALVHAVLGFDNLLVFHWHSMGRRKKSRPTFARLASACCLKHHGIQEAA